MNESRTHYQVSLTSRQALGLFLGLLAALGLAYFLGLMTGLAGRDDAGAGDEAPVASAPAPVGPAEEPPVPERGVVPRGSEPPAPEPTAAPPAGEPESIRAFEDRPSDAPPPKPAGETRSGGEGEGFWVQVFSLSSASEARERSVSLASRGYPARVLESTSGRKLWRVRVGPYATREQAEAASRKLQREEKTETWIVPQGQ